MAFWSGQELAKRAAGENLISNFDADNIDCASYTLRLGCQAFITQEGHKFRKLLNRGYVPGLKNLEPNGVVNIPPGQFAFLLTEEKVRMPADALGFISIKARHKYKGLVNVSGFHVDPGWDGYLMFSVFNAGPSDIVLKRGEELFLLWFAALDQVSEPGYMYQPTSEHAKPEIQVKYVQGLTQPVQSLPSLSRDVAKLRYATLRGDIALALAVATLGLLLALAAKVFTGNNDNKSQRTPDVSVTLSQLRPQSMDKRESEKPDVAAKSMGKAEPARPMSERGDGKNPGA